MFLLHCVYYKCLLYYYLFFEENQTPYNQRSLTLDRATQISVFPLGLPSGSKGPGMFKKAFGKEKET